MDKKPEKVISDYVKDGAMRINDDHIRYVIEKGDKIKYMFSQDTLLFRFKNDADLLISLVEDYCAGEYENVPQWVINSTVFTLLYVLEPLDRLPDFLPVIGTVDDYAMVQECLGMIKVDLEQYKNWKLLQS